ncbi:MAG: hypothetical protein LBE72_04875, partial [Rickettsia sp.]|nr:hypothetical protein [Rickettsia sp.]
DIKSSKVLDAYHMIERYKLTPAEYDLYVRTKLQEDAEELALAENFNNGKAERSIEIAKKMLAKGKSIGEITEFTELSIEKIEVLRENLAEDTITVLNEE